MNLEQVLRKLSVKEKIAFLQGEDFWTTHKESKLGLRSLRFSDGPNGLRKEGKGDNFGLSKSIPATCFPSLSLLAASFDPTLSAKMGKMIASEAKREEVDVLLGPGINIKRNPLCGRNFEYFSEDQLLAGKMASGYIKGVQETGLSSCMKHFCCNNQETNRMVQNSILDKRTLFDLYLKPFEIAIKEANPKAIMTSYNQVLGDYSSESSFLLKHTLRNRFAYKGLIISDWGAVNNPVSSIQAGLNLDMPGKDKAKSKEVLHALRKNEISINEIDEAIKPLLKMALERNNQQVPCDYKESLMVCEEIVKESSVLLKNADGILPINKNKKIGVLGPMTDNPRYQGSGSSKINPLFLDSPLKALHERQMAFTYYENWMNIRNDLAIQEAIKEMDTVVFFGGLTEEEESEGFDRQSTTLGINQLEAIDLLSKLNPNIVVVLQGGSVMDLSFSPKVKGILLEYLGGSKNGSGIIELLFGGISPSGRLPESFIPLVPQISKEKDILYSEGLYVGYSNLSRTKQKIDYPFGYGLSYTTFRYHDFLVKKNKLTFKITNDGTVNGKEVILLFSSFIEGDKCYKKLVYFDKKEIKAGETGCFEIIIDPQFFTFYDEKKNKEVQGSGKFTLELSKDSQESLFTFEQIVKGETPYLMPQAPVSLHQEPKKEDRFTINTTLGELRKSFLGRRLYGIFSFIMKKKAKGNKMILSMMDELPLRFLSLGTKGKFSYKKIKGLVSILNHRFLKGLFQILF